MLVFLISFSLIIDRVDTNLLVIFLESGHVFSCLRELSLFHTFSNIPVHEGTLGIHEIELVIKSCPSLSDGSCVGQHAHGTLNFSQISSWHHCGWLVVDTDFESSWAPVHKLDRSLCLDGGVHVLGNDVTSEEQTASHVLAVTWIALHHLIGWLEAGVGYLSYCKLFMVGLLSRDNWSVSSQREMNPRVGHQVGLELSEIHIESTIEPERSSDGGHNLSNETIQVGVRWSLDVQVATADVVDGFVVDHESAVRVLQGGVCCQDGVVRLNDSSGYLRSRVDGELQLGLLAVVNRKTLHQE